MNYLNTNQARSRVHLIEMAVNDRSWYRRKAEAMGFTFSGIVVKESMEGYGYEVLVYFECVCGTREALNFFVDENLAFNFVVDVSLASLLDPARRLFNEGSFSREHLLADGYTPNQVDEILAKGEQFERDNPR